MSVIPSLAQSRCLVFCLPPKIPNGLGFKAGGTNEILNSLHRHASFDCASLYCSLQIIAFFFFYRLKVYGNPASSESIGAIFPKASAPFVSLCHVLVILTVLQTFSLLLYSLG